MGWVEWFMVGVIFLPWSLVLAMLAGYLWRRFDRLTTARKIEGRRRYPCRRTRASGS